MNLERCGIRGCIPRRTVSIKFEADGNLRHKTTVVLRMTFYKVAKIVPFSGIATSKCASGVEYCFDEKR